MITLIIILGISVVILGYTTFNLLRKNEKQEDALSKQEEILASYLTYLNQISGIIDHTDKRIREIDARETFKSDDEIGFFFEAVKQIQNTLNQFKIK
jgi:hypothetical protein